MNLVAGIDIGNSTTELVIADASTWPPAVVAADRWPTRGRKGSAESGAAAASLLRRAERQHGLSVTTVFVTPQRPVVTRRLDVPEAPVDLGPLALLSLATPTPAGSGTAVGRPVPASTAISDVAVGEPVVLVAADPLGYRQTARDVERLVGAGRLVVAVLLAGDEAALVASRLPVTVPVVDGVDAAECLACRLVAVEVAPPGQQVRALADPIWLADALSLDADAHHHAQAAAATTRGHRSAAIGVHGRPGPTAVSGVGDTGGRLAADLDADADDVWSVDLAEVAALPGVRAGAVRDRAVLTASLTAGTFGHQAIDALTQAWAGPGRTVATVADETTAARLGALTTPGARSSAWVVDLGGGTVDVVPPSGSDRTGAGSGDLLTAAVRHALAISTGAAEWVKRGPATRIEAPHLASDESGERRFLSAPAPHGSVGWLVAPGPAGDLPFARDLPLAEWRTIRLAVKQRVFGANLARLLAHWPATERPAEVVLTGGPAGDDELVGLLNQALAGAVVGRSRVAGTLGHRWAVGYGLLLAGLSE